MTQFLASLFHVFGYSQLSNSQGGENKQGRGAKVVKSLNKIHEEGEFCKRLINIDDGMFAKRWAKSEKTISETPHLSE